MKTSRTVVLAGAVAQRPFQGGHAWVFLQYLLGFRQMGYDVLFVDHLPPDQSFDPSGRPCPVDRSVGADRLRRVMEAFGLGESYALLSDERERSVGLSREEVIDRVRNAELLINVMGYLRDDQILEAARLLVFLDIDPGFGQMWRELGLHDSFVGHDAFVTIGENVGRPGCLIPTCGLEWITTPQPIVLDHWTPAFTAGSGFTAVATWRGPYDSICYQDRLYGLRVHEFRKFIELPSRTGERFEVALDIDPADEKDRTSLVDGGWHLTDPHTVTADPWSYRRFIQRSGAEFMVAKNLYVDTWSGWFSDRSICYLASAKPVLAQNTGFDHRYPTASGLVSFSTIDGAAAGVEAIKADYRRHAQAAREIAEEFFDAKNVLRRLLDSLGVT